MKRHRDAAAGATPQDVAKGHVTKAKALMDAATRGLPALSAPAAAAVSQVPTSTPPWWTAHPSLHTNNLTLQQQMSRLAYLAQAHNQGAFGVGGEVQQAVPSQLLLPRFTSQLQMGQTHDGSVWCITAIPFTLTHYTITVPLPPGAWPEVQHGPPCSLTAEVYVPCSRGEQQQQQIMAPGGLDMPGEWRVLTSAPAMLCSCQGGALLYSSGLAAGLAGQQDLHLLRAQRNPGTLRLFCVPGEFLQPVPAGGGEDQHPYPTGSSSTPMPAAVFMSPYHQGPLPPGGLSATSGSTLLSAAPAPLGVLAAAAAAGQGYVPGAGATAWQGGPAVAYNHEPPGIPVTQLAARHVTPAALLLAPPAAAPGPVSAADLAALLQAAVGAGFVLPGANTPGPSSSHVPAGGYQNHPTAAAAAAAAAAGYMLPGGAGAWHGVPAAMYQSGVPGPHTSGSQNIPSSTAPSPAAAQGKVSAAGAGTSPGDTVVDAKEEQPAAERLVPAAPAAAPAVQANPFAGAIHLLLQQLLYMQQQELLAAVGTGEVPQQQDVPMADHKEEPVEETKVEQPAIGPPVAASPPAPAAAAATTTAAGAAAAYTFTGLQPGTMDWMPLQQQLLALQQPGWAAAAATGQEPQQQPMGEPVAEAKEEQPAKGPPVAAPPPAAAQPTAFGGLPPGTIEAFEQQLLYIQQRVLGAALEPGGAPQQQALEDPMAEAKEEQAAEPPVSAPPPAAPAAAATAPGSSFAGLPPGTVGQLQQLLLALQQGGWAAGVETGEEPQQQLMGQPMEEAKEEQLESEPLAPAPPNAAAPPAAAHPYACGGLPPGTMDGAQLQQLLLLALQQGGWAGAGITGEEPLPPPPQQQQAMEEYMAGFKGEPVAGTQEEDPQQQQAMEEEEYEEEDYEDGLEDLVMEEEAKEEQPAARPPVPAPHLAAVPAHPAPAPAAAPAAGQMHPCAGLLERTDDWVTQQRGLAWLSLVVPEADWEALHSKYGLGRDLPPDSYKDLGQYCSFYHLLHQLCEEGTREEVLAYLQMTAADE